MDRNDFLVDVHALQALYDARMKSLESVPDPGRTALVRLAAGLGLQQDIARLQLIADSYQSIKVPVIPQNAALLRKAFLRQGVFDQGYYLVSRGEISGNDSEAIYSRIVSTVSADIAETLSALTKSEPMSWKTWLLIGGGLAVAGVVVYMATVGVPDEPSIDSGRDESLGWKMPYAPRLYGETACAR